MSHFVIHDFERNIYLMNHFVTYINKQLNYFLKTSVETLKTSVCKVLHFKSLTRLRDFSLKSHKTYKTFETFET